MSKKLELDTAYQGYVFLGWTSGMFEADKNRKLPYYIHMFVFSPVSTCKSEDYKASSFRTS